MSFDVGTDDDEDEEEFGCVVDVPFFLDTASKCPASIFATDVVSSCFVVDDALEVEEEDFI